MKNYICVSLGAVGSVISSAFGGWSTGITTLLICMAVDYLTGLMCAGIFKKSRKSKNGGLESRVGWKGICRKFVTLLIVVIAYRLDLLIGTSYIRDAVVIAFVVNELISIIENCGLMGITMPAPIQKAIDILTSKGEQK